MAKSQTEKIAETIRGRMADRGISSLALSHSTGIARMTLTRRLSGFSPFNTDELAAVCRDLDLDAASLLAEAAA
jgi:cyanate lyase